MLCLARQGAQSKPRLSTPSLAPLSNGWEGLGVRSPVGKGCERKGAGRDMGQPGGGGEEMDAEAADRTEGRAGS